MGTNIVTKQFYIKNSEDNMNLILNTTEDKLNNGKCYLTSWGIGKVAPLSRRILIISKLFLWAAKIKGVISAVNVDEHLSTPSQL